MDVVTLQAAIAAAKKVSGQNGKSPAALMAAHPEGYVDWHRGGAQFAPENTLEALRMALALNAESINFDCVSLADGGVALMHDLTIDRTTTGTGNAADQTTASIQGIATDPSVYLGPGWANGKVPLLSQVLAEAGGRVHLLLECTDAAVGARIVRDVVARGLQSTVSIESRNLPDLAPAVAAGIEAVFIDDTGATPAATLLAAGVKTIAMKTTGTSASGATQATINTYRTAGLKVQIYSPLRKADCDLYTGVSAWHADEPHYLLGLLTGDYRHRRTSDSFKSGFFPHGFIAAKANGGGAGGDYKDIYGRTRGTILAGGKHQWQGAGGWTLDGELCPVAASLTASNWTLTGTTTFDTLDTDATSYFTVAVCTPTDDSFHNGTLTAANNGYFFTVRQNGAIEPYKVTAGTLTSGGSNTVGTAVTVAGTAVPWTVAVTGTTVKFTRTDTGASATITDSAFRGGFIHHGATQKNSVGRFSFSGLAIS